MLRVYVAAETAAMRTRIADALAHSDFEMFVVEAETGEAIVELKIDPTAIVVQSCDVELPQAMARLRLMRRHLREHAIVIVSPVASGTGIRRALDAGAYAIVFESELESTLAVALRAVASGQSVVPHKVRANVEPPTLSHRERQVLGHVAQGLTNAQIADKLFLSESTVKSHLSSAFVKCGVRSRREAAAVFMELERRNPPRVDPEAQILPEPA